MRCFDGTAGHPAQNQNASRAGLLQTWRCRNSLGRFRGKALSIYNGAASDGNAVRNKIVDDQTDKKENKMKTKGKVLVLVSTGHGLPLQDGKVYSGAGYYLNELTVPVRALMKDGYEITFANPKGNTPQLDVNSATAMFFGGDEAKACRNNK